MLVSRATIQEPVACVTRIIDIRYAVASIQYLGDHTVWL
jgi:hypothetical protein